MEAGLVQHAVDNGQARNGPLATAGCSPGPNSDEERQREREGERRRQKARERFIYGRVKDDPGN